MNALAKPLLLLVVTTAGCRGVMSPAAASLTVQPGEARQMVAAGALLLDVRTSEEFADGHIDGAQNVPLAQIDEQNGRFSKTQPIVVYCASGRRSAAAAQHLAAAGFTVRDLGAMSNWKR